MQPRLELALELAAAARRVIRSCNIRPSTTQTVGTRSTRNLSARSGRLSTETPLNERFNPRPLRGATDRRVGSTGTGNVLRVTRTAPIVASLAAVIGQLALLAVFVFWGASNSSDALPYFAVPGVLFALSAALGFRMWHVRPHR